MLSGSRLGGRVQLLSRQVTAAFRDFDYVRCIGSGAAALTSPLVLKAAAAVVIYAFIQDFLFNPPESAEARAPLFALVAAAALSVQLVPHRDEPANVFSHLPAGKLTRFVNSAYFVLAPITRVLLGAGVALGSVFAAFSWLVIADPAGSYVRMAGVMLALSVLGVLGAGLTYIVGMWEQLVSSDNRDDHSTRSKSNQ